MWMEWILLLQYHIQLSHHHPHILLCTRDIILVIPVPVVFPGSVLFPFMAGTFGGHIRGAMCDFYGLCDSRGGQSRLYKDR